jgi:hypothetical protein
METKLTAKEEALVIYGRYYVAIVNSETDMSQEILVSNYAQKFSLIAINTLLEKQLQEEWGNYGKSDKLKFYEEIKEEIKKL